MRRVLTSPGQIATMQVTRVATDASTAEELSP
jgi:hypothetical protein